MIPILGNTPLSPARSRIGFGGILAAAAVLIALTALPALAFNLQIRVQDRSGQIIPARVHLTDSRGNAQPGYPDSTLLSHYEYWMGGFFYPDGPVTLDVPAGNTVITAGRGFEWRTMRITPDVESDTTVVLTLDHPVDLRAQGWYSGDSHVHTQHPPVELPVDPTAMHRIAQAEDLAMTWIVDGDYQFTGAPHVASTPDAILYYTTEWRNQAYGHAALLNLRQLVGFGCCTPPSSAYPMLSDVREAWAPGPDQAMILSHPRTDADFMYDGGWPGWGLGREAPVLAASGNLDVYDIASYSNRGDVNVDDWYALLNCGFHVPCGAGTDVLTDTYWGRVPGGYRVYVKENGEHSASGWVEGLRAGRSFVTNYPLIPIFTVDDAEAGSVLERTGPATLQAHMKVVSLLPVSSVTLMRNGAAEQSFSVPPGVTTWETTVPVTVTESSWLALRVNGTTSSPFVAESEPLRPHRSRLYPDRRRSAQPHPGRRALHRPDRFAPDLRGGPRPLARLPDPATRPRASERIAPRLCGRVPRAPRTLHAPQPAGRGHDQRRRSQPLRLVRCDRPGSGRPGAVRPDDLARHPVRHGLRRHAGL